MIREGIKMKLQQEFPGFQSATSFMPYNYNRQPFKRQLLKWIGNKQRFAHEIINYFPGNFNSYFEPFLGSGAVLGCLAPKVGVASDVISPLIEIWKKVVKDPDKIKRWYTERFQLMEKIGKEKAYYFIRSRYNNHQNAADFLYLSRSCYGGVIRFRQEDGYMSTPCGVHSPISPNAFSQRVNIWSTRLQGCTFYCTDFENLFDMAQKNDIIYCDPPYTTSQTIVYGAQTFSLQRLMQAIEKAKSKGVYVLLSIDGSKKSGKILCDVKFPPNLFEREVFVNCGRSMLRRFQREGQTLEDEVVSDRLLLTY